jgi:hypothetical protein
MKDLAARERDLEAVLSSARKTVVTIHPQAAQRYRAKVGEIQQALTKGDAASQGAVALVRSMIERIAITPQPDRMALEVFGEVSMLLGNRPSTEGELANCISGCGGWIRSSTYFTRTLQGCVDLSVSRIGCLSHRESRAVACRVRFLLPATAPTPGADPHRAQSAARRGQHRRAVPQPW